MIEYVCPRCRISFKDRRSKKRKYCSRKCAMMGNARTKGRLLSEDHRRKISEVLKGGHRPLFSEEHKKKLSIAHIGKIGKLAGNWQGGPIEKTCEWCKKIYFARVSETCRRRFCSVECLGRWRSVAFRGRNSHFWNNRTIMKQCAYCGNEFQRCISNFKPQVKNVFCSQYCFNIWQRGENHPEWEGGKSFEPYGIDFDVAIKRQAKRRDRYMCQLCQTPQNKTILQIHHIDYDKHHNDLNNLITLCVKCHAKTNANRRHWQILLSNKINQDFQYMAAATKEVMQDEIPL